MTSFIFHPQDLEEEDMNVRTSLQGAFPQPYGLAQDNNITKSALLRRKNNSMVNSVIRPQKEQGIIYGAKFSDKTQEEGQQYTRISRSVKIDCSGPANIINNPDTLANEYVPTRSKINEQNAPAVTALRLQQPEKLNSQIFPQQNVADNTLSGKVKAENNEAMQKNGKCSDINKKFTIIFLAVLLLLFLQIRSEPLKQWTSKHIAEPLSSGIFR